jgi:hypothetical protein
MPFPVMLKFRVCLPIELHFMLLSPTMHLGVKFGPYMLFIVKFLWETEASVRLGTPEFMLRYPAKLMFRLLLA